MSTWILLRGLTRETRHWGDFPDTLRAACDDAAVVPIDLPGNGSLCRQASPLRVADMAASCHTQLRESGIAPPYHVLAMSLGAMVAVEWARQYPEEMAGCVLINTSLRPFSPFHHRLRPRNYALLARLLLGTEAAYRESVILRLTSNRGECPEKVAEWAGYARQNPVSATNALRQLVAAACYAAPAGRPPSPMLILASRNDRLVDPRCSHRLAECWGASFAEHPSAGHDLPLDDGSWVADQVRRWFDNGDARCV